MSHYKIHDQQGLCFLTLTVVGLYLLGSKVLEDTFGSDVSYIYIG
ncbi:MAG: hypothetical protein AAGG68_30490 [Bacteroidota bacterium]